MSSSTRELHDVAQNTGGAHGGGVPIKLGNNQFGAAEMNYNTRNTVRASCGWGGGSLLVTGAALMMKAPVDDSGWRFAPEQARLSDLQQPAYGHGAHNKVSAAEAEEHRHRAELQEE